LLTNLFMHYAFDTWMAREFPGVAFERYCDDGVAHCRTEAQARQVRDAVAARLAEFGMELHPEKTRIVYCKDADRRGDHEATSFVFLGYEFRPRLSKNRWGKHFVNFTPAVSRAAVRRMSREIRSWHIPRRSDKSLRDLALMFNRIVQGRLNYYGRFYKSMLYPLLQQLNQKLVLWAMKKYRRLRRRERRTRQWLRTIAREYPWLFAHWRFGAYP
jgi:RNA-directed DNA polymerase